MIHGFVEAGTLQPDTEVKMDIACLPFQGENKKDIRSSVIFSKKN